MTGSVSTSESDSLEAILEARSIRKFVLVLNATYEPLCVISVRRATILVLSDKAETVTAGNGVLRSPNYEFQIPSVIRLARYVRINRRITAGLSRRAIFTRDGGKCAYCSGSAETIDHVQPKSKGGQHAWDNVVSACAKCNHKKGDKTLAELGWRLPRNPAAPSGIVWRILGTRPCDPSWTEWLGITA